MNEAKAKMTMQETVCLCPFCAAPDAHRLEVDGDGWALVCGNCGAIGPIAGDEEKALVLWNARPLGRDEAGFPSPH